MTPTPMPAIESPPADWMRYRERGSNALLRLMTRLSLWLGRPLSHGALYPIAAYFFVFAPSAGRQSRSYLRRALGRDPSVRECFRHILYFAACIHDRVFLLNDEFAALRISLEGEEVVRAHLGSGQGAILMGAHLGSFELMRSIGRRQPGLHVSMAMYEHNAHRLNATLAAINPAARPDVISLGQVDAMLHIAERLDRGALVGMLGDRTLGDEPVHAVTLLGERAYLPSGPMRVAAILRRRVIFMAGLYRGGNRYHVVFAPLADFSAIGPGARDAAVRDAVLRYAALLDRYCRSDPFNWFNFFDFWRAPTEPPAA